MASERCFFLERAEKLQNLNLSFVPKIVDIGITARDSALYLVAQWIEGNALDTSLRFRGADIVAKALISNVRHMHSLGFAHGDLKPENIIVNGGDVFIIDVLDFHHDANEVYNSEYSPINSENCTAFERDNFAVMKICAELLRIDWGEESSRHPAVSTAIIKELQDVMTNPYAEHSQEIEDKYYRLKPSELFAVGGVSHLSCSS